MFPPILARVCLSGLLLLHPMPSKPRRSPRCAEPPPRGAGDGRPPQLVVLLRHGESLAQARKGSRKDPALLDCGLSPRGRAQARAVDASAFPPAELVVSSPLARALLTATAVRFGDAGPPAAIVAHPALRELGSGIPENQPRPVAAQLRAEPALARAPIDFGLLPPSWPADEGSAGAARGPERLARALAWLRARPERVVWVVCHHNVIQALVAANPANARLERVPNCAPIACALRDGARGAELEVLRDAAAWAPDAPAGAAPAGAAAMDAPAVDAPPASPTSATRRRRRKGQTTEQRRPDF